MNNELAVLNYTYLTELAKSGEKALRQLDGLTRFLVERNCTYRGEPMPTFLKPVFISPRQAELLKHTVDIICGALDKFIKLLQALLECYREFQSGHPGLPDRPTIAIVDWEDLATSSEFELLKTFFEEKGYPTIITSPRKITVTGDRVTVDGNEIHLIYRRVITRELLEKLDEVEEYIQAIKGGYACLCNPFQSYIVGNKKVLSLLTNPRFQDIYTDEEKEIIEQSIPWTRILADETATYRGSAVELRSFISQNKDDMVLKPANSHGGKDVHLGRETDREIWDNLIETRIASEEWVVQEYVPIPQEFFPTIGDKTTISLKKVNINPFAFRGEYAGTISRISESSIINMTIDGPAGEKIPNLILISEPGRSIADVSGI